MSRVKKGYKETEIGVIPEDWIIRELKDITFLLTNGFVGVAKIHYSEENDSVLYIQGFNVKENSFNFTGIKKVSKRFHQEHMRSSLQCGDLLTVQTGDVGLTTIVPKELEGANCHALIISRYNTNLINSKYISYYLNSYLGRTRLKEIETGTTMKHINVGNFQFFTVPIPPLKEQQAIAEALSDIDALIKALNKQIEKKKNIKQGAMQELLTGKKRLQEFTEKWLFIELGLLLRVKHGKDQKSVQSLNGIYPILGTGGILGYSNKSLYEKESILIGRKGTIDKPRYMSEPFWSVDTLFYTEINEGVSTKFLYYLLKTIDWYSYNEASGVPSLNAKTIEKIEILLPPIKEEQTAIAQILTDMDNEIEQLEKKRDKYLNIKSGMMQQLLTGQIRLKE